MTLVSCLLLKRLKHQLEKRGIRPIIVHLVGGLEGLQGNEPPALVAAVRKCATPMGYQFVSQLPLLRTALTRGRSEYDSNYVMTKGVHGHLSVAGNAGVAMLVAEALDEPAAPGTADGWMPPPFIPGDGQNLLPDVAAEKFSKKNVSLALDGEPGPLPNEPVLRLATRFVFFRRVEHYSTLDWKGTRGGPHTLSVYVKGELGGLRLQLLDAVGNGVIADYNFETAQSGLQQFGKAQDVGFSSEPAGEGWVRLALTGTLPGSSGRIITQLTGTSGQTEFMRGGFSVDLQGPMLEYGKSASGFCRFERCPESPRG